MRPPLLALVALALLTPLPAAGGPPTMALVDEPPPPPPPAPPPPSACRRARHPGLADGPVLLGFGDGEFGAGHRACARRELFIAARALLQIDLPDFYGAITGRFRLGGSLPLGPRAELFASLELLQIQYVQNASLKGTAYDFAQTTVGGAYQLYDYGDLVLTLYGRLLLPTASTPHVRTLGFEGGLAASFRRWERLELHGWLGGDLALGLSAATALPRGGGAVQLGLQYSPWTWLGLALDFVARFGHRGAFDDVGGAAALRFRLRGQLGLELAATVARLTADRSDYGAQLRVHYRF